MRFRKTFYSPEHWYWLGVDELTGFYFASFPVTASFASYEEYYKLTDEEHALFAADPAAALAFVEECRRQDQHDIRLLQKPGWNRGSPMRPAP